jgi:hypothetical protein
MLEALAAEVEAVFSVGPEAELLALLVPHTREVRRRVRIALHLVLEHAEDLHQFLTELDELAIYLAGHDDTEAGSVLLAFSDQLREEVDR